MDSNARDADLASLPDAAVWHLFIENSNESLRSQFPSLASVSDSDLIERRRMALDEMRRIRMLHAYEQFPHYCRTCGSIQHPALMTSKDTAIAVTCRNGHRTTELGTKGFP